MLVTIQAQMSALLTARLEEEEEEGGDGGEGLLEDDAGYLLSLYSFRNKKSLIGVSSVYWRIKEIHLTDREGMIVCFHKRKWRLWRISIDTLIQNKWF